MGLTIPLIRPHQYLGKKRSSCLGEVTNSLTRPRTLSAASPPCSLISAKKAVPGGVGEIVGRLTHGARGYGGSNDDAFGDPSQVFLARVFGFGRLLALHHRRGRTPNRRNLSLAGVALGKSWSRSLLHDVRQFVRHESAVIRPP